MCCYSIDLQMQIVPHVFRSATPFKLPHGWVVEEKPRSNRRYAGVVDRVLFASKLNLFNFQGFRPLFYT